MRIRATLKPPKKLGGTSVGTQNWSSTGIVTVAPASDRLLDDLIDVLDIQKLPLVPERIGGLATAVAQIATHKVDLTPEEITERGKKARAAIS